MCDYQGYEFGAPYPDSFCVDGQLFDADDDFEPMDFIPCPMCNPKGAIGYWTDRNDHHGLSRRKARKKARLLVADIRRNRGVETLLNPRA